MATSGYMIIGPDGRETAPFDSDALVSYATRGFIQPTTEVFDPTVGQWIPASQVNALASLNGGMPSSPPPNPYSPQQPYYPYQTGPQKKPFPRVAAVAIGVGVGLLVVLAAFGVGKLASSTQSVSTTDGLYAVSLPAFWYEHHSQNPKIVSYISETDGMLIMRTASTPAGTGAEFDTMIRQIVASNEDDFHVSSLTSQPVALTIGGFPARQYEIQDNDPKDPSLFRVTFVSTPDGIYDISVFAPTDTMREDAKEQDALIASFHRTSKVAPRAPIGANGGGK